MVRRPLQPRGVMLLEVVVSLAIFVVAGGAILALVRQTMAGLDQSRQAAKAADLARSAMAKIEAGIETAQTLNGPVQRQADSPGASAEPTGWELQIDTDLSQFRGLTRVSIHAMKHGGAGQIEAQYTLVQLVRLGSKGEDKVGEEDALAEKARQGLSRQNPRAKPGKTGGAP